MEKHKNQGHAQYYFVTISSSDGIKLLANNNERAFILSQLQDLLNTRSLLEESFTNYRLAHHIDLLAFSLLPLTMQFVLFAIAPQSVQAFTNILIERLQQYKTDQVPIRVVKSESIVQIKLLLGPHEALQHTLALHRAHKDWEHDRYSSIGFYLHDRRGSWIRLWRLTHLYDNQPENYLQLIQPSEPLMRE
jgi:hypothetical protein